MQQPASQPAHQTKLNTKRNVILFFIFFFVLHALFWAYLYKFSFFFRFIFVTGYCNFWDFCLSFSKLIDSWWVARRAALLHCAAQCTVWASEFPRILKKIIWIFNSFLECSCHQWNLVVLWLVMMMKAMIEFLGSCLTRVFISELVCWKKNDKGFSFEVGRSVCRLPCLENSLFETFRRPLGKFTILCTYFHVKTHDLTKLKGGGGVVKVSLGKIDK